MKRWILTFLIIILLIFITCLAGCLNEQENKIPIAFFTRDEVPIYAGKVVRFVDDSEDEDGNIVSWSWNLGDGNTSNEQNVTHTYLEPGKYLVTLIVTNNKGLKSKPYFEEITVLQSITYQVHEWGVFAKGYECKNVSVLTEAPETFFVYKPIIYFHSLKNKTNIEVEIDSIRNVTSKPEAVVKNSTIFWDVVVEDDFVYASNGTQYPYLFYEGEINYSINLTADVSINDKNVTFYIKNLENYKFSNIYIIYGYSTGIPNYRYRGITYVQIDNLQKDEETSITVQLKNDTMYDTEHFFNSLLQEGLTVEEASELINYWEEWWFYPTNLNNYSRVIFTIPQSVYDKQLPIKIKPEPEAIKRVGIVTLTNIPINHQ